MEYTMTAESLTTPNLSAIGLNFETLDITYDSHRRALLYLIKPFPIPCFTSLVLSEIEELQDEVSRITSEELRRHDEISIRYLVAASGARNSSNFGGDLSFFLDVLRSRNKDALREYAQLAVRVLFNNYRNLGQPITTIAVLKGPTLGAGFEAALSCDIIIADRAVKVGFPEVLFNMFPGMGAYSFLARRIAPVMAERMIISGKLYSADELYDQGVIDVIAEEGIVDSKVLHHIESSQKSAITLNGLLKMRNKINPVTFQELSDIADIWVDAVFELSPTDVKRMERLEKAQRAQFSPSITPIHRRKC